MALLENCIGLPYVLRMKEKDPEHPGIQRHVIGFLAWPSNDGVVSLVHPNTNIECYELPHYWQEAMGIELRREGGAVDIPKDTIDKIIPVSDSDLRLRTFPKTGKEPLFYHLVATPETRP